MNKAHRTGSVSGLDLTPKDVGAASARGISWAVSAEAIDFFLRVISVAVLARILLPEHFGLISMVTAITAIAERFKDAGLAVATIQFREINHSQISNLFWVNILFGWLLAAIVAVASLPISVFYGDDRLIAITCAIAVSFLFGGATVQHQALLRRTMRFRPIAIIQIAATTGSIALAVIVAVLGGEYWALVAREVGRSVILMFGTWFCLPWKPGLPSRGSGVRKMLGFGGNITLTNVVFYVSYSLDQVLIGKVFGADPLGIYRQGYNLVTAPSMHLGYPAALVGEPALSRLQDDPEGYRQYLRKLLFLLSLVSMPPLFFIVVYADVVVALALGDGWEAAVPVFRILGLAFFMQPTVTILGCIMISCGFARRTVFLALMHGATLVALFVTLLRFGIVGIAMAHAAAFYLLLGPKIFLALRGTPATPGLFVSAIGRSLLCTLGTAAVVGFLRSNVTFESAAADFAAGILGGAIVFSILWLALPGGREKLREVKADALSFVKNQRQILP